MYARFDRVVLRGQTERVEAHGLEHFVALHAEHARVDVGQAEIIPMSEVQVRARGVREHFEHVLFLIRARNVEGVELFLLPPLFPFFFDFQKVHISVPGSPCLS